MTTKVEDLDVPGRITFKRRKTTHSKKVSSDVPMESNDPHSSNIGSAESALSLHGATYQDESGPNLKHVRKLRSRIKERAKEHTNRVDLTMMDLKGDDLPKQDFYASRFVAQTGQVVDREDIQIAEYVDARMAEQNYRKHGWPIPKHLHNAVAAFAPNLVHSKMSALPNDNAFPLPASTDAQKGGQIAASMGKLQEIDLDDQSQLRWVKPSNSSTQSVDVGPQPARKTRRLPKRRNSDDLRRDDMVEAVLREARLEYFDAQAAVSAGPEDNDDTIMERFRQEYQESLELRQQRKAPPGPAGKGMKETAKGPKLGGSRSARAAMRLQEGQTAKEKR